MLASLEEVATAFFLFFFGRSSGRARWLRNGLTPDFSDLHETASAA
jgi:hypothetical protein